MNNESADAVLMPDEVKGGLIKPPKHIFKAPEPVSKGKFFKPIKKTKNYNFSLIKTNTFFFLLDRA